MKTKQLIAIIVACALLIVTGLAGMDAAGLVDIWNGSSGLGEDYVSIISVYGSIGETEYDIFGREVTLSTGTILDYIDAITEDENNKGIFLAIDSPGGAVYDSDKIYMGLMDYKEKTGRPIVASCMSQMCSGAYYIASAADEIYAERTADVGSIGVYLEATDISELCKKLGIKVDYIRSSENKAMGNMYNEMTEEQRAIYQAIIDEDYERFLDVVQAARGYDRETLRAIADGRSYSASQGLANGLIDGIIECDEALERFEEQLDVYYEDYPYVETEGWLSSIITGFLKALPGSEYSLLEELMDRGNGKAMYHAG